MARRFIWKANGWRESYVSNLSQVQQWATYPLRDADLWQRLDAPAEKHIIHHRGSRSGYSDLEYQGNRMNVW